MAYTSDDLLKIQGVDHICKTQMKRNKEIEEKYQTYMKTFNFEDFKKNLFIKTHDWKLCFNEFPYDISEELDHLILWFNTPEMNIKLAEKIIKTYFPDNVIWFANSPEIMSIKQLFHVHIFNNKLNIRISGNNIV